LKNGEEYLVFLMNFQWFTEKTGEFQLITFKFSANSTRSR